MINDRSVGVSGSKVGLLFVGGLCGSRSEASPMEKYGLLIAWRGF